MRTKGSQIIDFCDSISLYHVYQQRTSANLGSTRNNTQARLLEYIKDNVWNS